MVAVQTRARTARANRVGTRSHASGERQEQAPGARARPAVCFGRHRIRIQRLVDSMYDQAKAYIDNVNVASMDGPIKLNRLKKATGQSKPEEHI